MPGDGSGIGHTWRPPCQPNGLISYLLVEECRRARGGNFSFDMLVDQGGPILRIYTYGLREAKSYYPLRIIIWTTTIKYALYGCVVVSGFVLADLGRVWDKIIFWVTLGQNCSFDWKC